MMNKEQMLKSPTCLTGLAPPKASAAEGDGASTVGRVPTIHPLLNGQQEDPNNLMELKNLEPNNN